MAAHGKKVLERQVQHNILAALTHAFLTSINDISIDNDTQCRNLQLNFQSDEENLLFFPVSMKWKGEMCLSTE